jgi:glucosamine 6-phosphate synthetase-like amidotransferase/phosphosugar isomerase protein
MVMDVGKVSAGLLAGIANRGPDATGAAWYDVKEQAVKVTKIAVNAAKFLAARRDVLPETTPVMILHTRMATHGSVNDRVNNHPVRHANILGVHNGVLWNDDEIFKDLGYKRNGAVDSEAIFALLSHGADPTKVLSEIGGDAALAWINLDEPDVLHLALVNGRPLNIAQTKEGSLVAASTAEACRSALKAAGLEASYEFQLEEAKYMKVVGGTITDYVDIPGVTVNKAWTGKYSYTSGNTTAAQYAETLKEIEKRRAARAIEPPKTGSEDGLFLEAGKNSWQEERDDYFIKTIEELVDMATNQDAKAVSELHARGRSANGSLIAGVAAH